MWIANKVGQHLFDKCFGTAVLCGRAAERVIPDAPKPVRIVVGTAAFMTGAFFSPLRVANPLDLADAILTPEDELEARINRIDEYFD